MEKHMVIEQLKKHRSIRRYKSRKISEPILKNILSAGVRAATSGNMQFYSIVVTRSPRIKKRLYVAHGKQEMILEAPLVLTFCADLHRVNRWFQDGDAKTKFSNSISLLRGIVDATIVAQNVVLAAESLGLGICYMGSTLMNCDQICRILKLPKMVFPVTSIVMGYPNENPVFTDRLPLNGVIHSNTYKTPSQLIIKNIYKKRNKEAMSRFMKNAALAEKLKQAGIQTTAQAYSLIKYSNEALKTYSTTLDRCLMRQWQLRLK